MSKIGECIYQDDDFLVLIKPDDISINENQDEETAFFTLVKQVYGEQMHLVHRLDKVTSGIMLFAKTAKAASDFGQMFMQHKVQKYYLAIAGNHPKKKQGMIKGDMEKSRRGTYKLMPTQLNPAITQFFSYSFIPGLRLYLLKPKTGKTHQLRVALKSIGVPILGDVQYGGDKSDRVYLHAYALYFNYKGQDYAFKSSPSSGEYYHREECEEFLKSHENLNELNWP